MGQDKSRLRLGGRTLLSHIRATARRAQLPVRVIRRDLVPRCGPMGGIYTALVTSRSEAVLFLSCDMPFVSEVLIKKILARVRPRTKGLFVFHEEIVGFPFLLTVKTLPQIEQLRAQNRFSLQFLAKTIQAAKITPGASVAAQLFNVNTPEEWRIARRLWRRSQSAQRGSAMSAAARSSRKTKMKSSSDRSRE
jgi:molybdopterin-guanine dinucleotide biosynthesis protein A